VIVAAAFKTLLRITVTTRVNSNGQGFYFPLSGHNNQSYYLNKIDEFYTSFINGLGITQPSVITKGETLGRSAANSVWNARAQDGFNRTVPDYYVPTFQVGKWYPRTNEAQVYPLASYEKPIAIPTPYHFLVPPPHFQFDNDYLADLAYTKDKGSAGSTTRTQAEGNSAIFAVILAGGRYQTAMLTQIYPRLVTYADFDLRAFTRLHAIAAFAQADSYITVANQKATYQNWRPWQAITTANDTRWASLYPGLAALADPTWVPFQTTPNNPEYPAGHPTASSLLAHTIRRLTGWEVIPGGPIRVVSPNPNISENYTSIGEIEEKMVNARVFGGMHLRESGRVGVALGHKIADYIIANWLQPRQNWND